MFAHLAPVALYDAARQGQLLELLPHLNVAKVTHLQCGWLSICFLAGNRAKLAKHTMPD